MLFNLKVNCLARIVVTAFKSNSKSFETDAFKINIDIMSQSKRTLEDSSLQSSGNSRGEEADVSNEISLLSQPLDLSSRNDAVGSEPDKNSVNQNNREGENEKHEVEPQADPVPVEDSRDTVYGFEPRVADRSIAAHKRNRNPSPIKRHCPTCKITVTNAKANAEERCPLCGTNLDFQCSGCDKMFNSYNMFSWHQRSCLTRFPFECGYCAYTTANELRLHQHIREQHADGNKLIALSDRKELSDQINRFCPSCKIIVANAKKAIKQLCTQCGTNLIYQCARCNKESNTYDYLFVHIRTLCKFDCPLCGSLAEPEDSLKIHLRTCVNEIHYRCFFCEHMDKSREVLRRHIATAHKDILKRDCCQDKADSYECEPCQIKVTICETCRTGFSSIELKLQEHQSCKPPVLKCVFCMYNTNVYEIFKTHILNAHSSASTSKN